MRTTAANQTIVEVPLDNGTSWTGTEAQLRAQHPTWVKYARIAQQTTRTTSQDDDAEDNGESDDPHPGRLRTSSRTYVDRETIRGKRIVARPEVLKTPVPPRHSAQTHTEDIPQAQPRRKRRGRGLRAHPLLYLGLGMIAMLLLWQVGAALSNWWQLHQDDSTYGRPRTAHYDVVVGHNDDEAHPTHIIALNLNAHIVIIEIPGGDTSKSRIYSGTHIYGIGADLAPITLTFKDVNGDGRLDMIVNVQGGHMIYLNQKVNNVWQFVPQQSQ